MSKLCGVWHFDRRPVSTLEAEQLRSALRLSGYRNPCEFHQDGLLMGWAAGSTLDPSGLPFESSESCARSVCLMDGRLDNRPLISHRCEALPPGSPDSATILSLFQQQGAAALREVLGDWSLCVWDAPRREVILASDFAGVRPLYYHRSAHTLYWSSSLDDVVLWSGAAALDDSYVAGFLLGRNGQARTPYAAVDAVPPGKMVRHSETAASVQAFWSISLDQEIRYRDDREYDEHLLQLFRDSVAGRIAGGGAVCAELSGGLDSSSVVCMADWLRRRPGAPPVDLNTFSYTGENSSDERYFREVERVCELSGNHLVLENWPAADPAQVGAIPGWWEPRYRELARRMEGIGAGVLLTGQFGDLIMGNTTDDSTQVAGLLSARRFRQSCREAYAWAKSMQAPVYPILWRGIREAFLGWMPPIHPSASVGAIQGSAEDSVSNHLRERFAVDGRQSSSGHSWRHAPPGRRRQIQSVAEILSARTFQTPSALQHLSYSHPFTHRPLIEYMLAVPSRLVCRPDQPRLLMRRAFAGLLPPLILNRKSKAAFTAAYRRALLPMAATLLQENRQIQLVERGYLERDNLLSRLERYTQGLDCNETQLRSILLLEFWIRQRAGLRSQPVRSSHVEEVTLR